ncbi:MAG TPA: M20/M25/M40 family metallo-hydrolase [Vicinamibacterales bacterium]|nr:M20/M25/M40 family metallo-hydrolase [Vicinamibacterales bacterium]
MKSSFDTVGFARSLINIDSTTGRETDAGRWLSRELEQLGYTVVQQPVSDGRANVYASLDSPVVVLSTHFDCVPPFFPSRLENGKLYGRGSCDAKGILAAQVAAAERLKAAGERRVGLLFVVGEERGSDGAAVANESPSGSRFLINGEPTDNRLGTGTGGVLRLRLRASGRAAHSATPEQGESAIDKLIDALIALRSIGLPSDAEIGSTYYSIGLIEGGIAPNVISPSASAEVLFRTVGPPEDILRAVQPLERLVTSEEILRVPVVRLHTVAGFPTAAFRFTTDVPFLDRWGTPLLFGPGSILVAHTSDEHLDLAELDRAIDSYERLARECLRS